MELIAHPDCFLSKYDANEYIGAPYTYKEISEKTKYNPCKTPYRIAGNFIYLGEIPRTNNFEITHPIGKSRQSGIWKDDYINDDTALVL